MTTLNALLLNNVASQETGHPVKESIQSTLPAAGHAELRRPYQSPVLTAYGDVRDITMGPTVGFGESGGGPFCAEGVNCP